MPTIDNLNIEISAQTKQANASLDLLVKRLGKVSSSLSAVNSRGLATMGSGVNKLSNAMNNFSNNTKTADFSRLARNLASISKVDASNFSAVASGVSSMFDTFNQMGAVSENAVQIGEVTKNISKFGNKSAVQAIDNIPKLTAVMKELMITLSKAPAVSQNVIQMTNALAALASNGSKVGSASRSLTRGLNRADNAMKSTKRHAMSLASSFGRLYTNYWMLIRAGQGLWTSVEGAMNYIETLNYFNAAFEQVAESAISSMNEAGKDSAEAYYKSFSDTAKQLTQKMTGFAISDNGRLQSGTGKSLGIDPNQLMQYQAMFAQMSSSIGITAETSVKLSQALTEIGADLASVKNMEFDKVWNDMASGLAGMSRTLDKYGVNIRNVNLQEKLHELGINVNISALNQNDKALLRTIILLESTRYAWGDLADTIDQPANQLRMLKNNFSNLARTIGNIFLPVVAKVLPYVNMLVVALQKLAEFIVNLLGFEGFDWGGFSSGSSDVMSDLYDSVADTGDALDSAAGSAKKLRHQLQGFDELNVINTQDDSSSGGSSGIGGGIDTGLLEGALDEILKEYQATWDEAFNNMEERYDNFANHVADAFKTGGLEGVGEYLSTELANQLKTIDWEKVYEGASGFGSGFANFLNGIFDKDADLLGAVGKTIANGLNTSIYTALSFGKTFDFEEFGKAIASGVNEFFGTFDFAALADTVDSWIQGVWTTVKTAVCEIKWEDVWNGVKEFLANLDISTVEIIFNAFALKYAGKILTGQVFKTIFDKLITKLFMTAFGGSMFSVTAAGLAILLGVSVAFEFAKVIFDEEEFNASAERWKKTNSEFIEKEKTKLKEFAKDVRTTFSEMYKKVVSGVLEFDKDFTAAVESWSSSVGVKINNWIENTKTAFSGFYKNTKETTADWTSSMKTKFKKLSNNITSSVSSWSSEAQETIEEFIANSKSDINDWHNSTKDKFSSWKTKTMEYINSFSKDGIEKLYSWKTTTIKDIEEWSNGVKNSFSLWSSNTKSIVKDWYEKMCGYFTKDKWSFSGIGTGLSEAFNNAIGGVKSIWNAFARWLNSKLTWKIEPIEIMGQKIFAGTTINLGKIPTFSTGGFPEDGLFMANHSELVGQFSNGKTAVANNKQITEGISDAVYRGNQENNMLMRQEIAILQKQNELLAQILEKETGISSKELFSSVKNSAKEYTARTGRPAFS